ncbi:MAG: DUF4942 domain-containing protein [Marinosulfonomonas sp.]
MVVQLKNEQSDFEWYPTTPEILSIVKADIEQEGYEHPSVLDCGAGDGRALIHLTEGKRYAIEKSQPLLQAMDNSIYIVGTEFTQQTLIDKKVDIIFSNSPYREFVAWAVKIVREANCRTVYLVMPERWKDNRELKDSIERRSAATAILGSFDFLSADRAARAKVEIVRVDLGYKGGYSRNYGPRIDPFDLWFDNEFNVHVSNEAKSKFDWTSSAQAEHRETVRKELVSGRDIVSVLEQLYLNELAKLMNNYKAIETLDSGVLRELDVNIKGLKEALKMRVEGLKDCFWKELFDNMDKITKRLTTDARKEMLDKLTAHTHVDFTASNAHAVLIWVIKNANEYFDGQLIALVERMTEQANVVLYKSNERVFTNEDWRYNSKPTGLDRYALDYRIVLDRIGGLCISSYEYEIRKHNGLSERAYEHIRDVITVAGNCGFDTSVCMDPGSFEWRSNKAVEFHYYDHRLQREVLLIVVRAFKNGNLHLRMSQKLICRLNVEFGRLRGWLKDAHEAAEELDIDIRQAERSFGANVRLGGDNVLKLCFDTAKGSHV